MKIGMSRLSRTCEGRMGLYIPAGIRLSLSGGCGTKNFSAQVRGVMCLRSRTAT